MRQCSIESREIVDKPEARTDFSLLRISPEFLFDQNIFYHFFHKPPVHHPGGNSGSLVYY